MSKLWDHNRYLVPNQ